MRKTLPPQLRNSPPVHPSLIDLYPALALASLVGYAIWEFAAMLP
jgi:hypothetical protein